mmetsp:Transcript_20197/g.42764  ORF Transcript_20197/g.42764 Transcript_20197/m.42764 type:complete len:94 (-) Transcript_20197:1208-1489(-)
MKRVNQIKSNGIKSNRIESNRIKSNQYKHARTHEQITNPLRTMHTTYRSSKTNERKRHGLLQSTCCFSNTDGLFGTSIYRNIKASSDYYCADR